MAKKNSTSPSPSPTSPNLEFVYVMADHLEEQIMHASHLAVALQRLLSGLWEHHEALPANERQYDGLTAMGAVLRALRERLADIEEGRGRIFDEVLPFRPREETAGMPSDGTTAH